MTTESNVTGPFRVSAPGRVCLFGEHQDYLGLPVIAMAINLRLTIEGVRNGDGTLKLDLHDLKEQEVIHLNGSRLDYRSRYDFLRSSVNMLLDLGLKLPGIKAGVKSDIPINSGSSSSTALVSAWMQFLLAMNGKAFEPQALATLAHKAEVLEFAAPGGMMDHMSIAHGGVQMIRFRPEPTAEELKVDLGTFVLGDSLEAKDTYGVLSRLQDPLKQVAANLAEKGRHLADLTVDEAKEMTRKKPELRTLVLAALKNRDLTQEAYRVLKTGDPDPVEIGRLLNEHQDVLAKELKVSTPKIDRMLAAAMKAGALGGKINGSGGGGAMFAYAPQDPARVAAAIEAEGGRAFIVSSDQGVLLHSDFNNNSR